MTFPPAVLTRLLAVTLLLLLGACAPFVPDYPARHPPASLPPRAPVPSPFPTPPPALTIPEEPRPVAGPAAALYHEAEAKLQRNDFGTAAMLLERALRIEPRNPHYWHALARSAYGLGNYRQAIEFCRKVDSLAGSDRHLAARNQELLTKAQQAMHE